MGTAKAKALRRVCLACARNSKEYMMLHGEESGRTESQESGFLYKMTPQGCVRARGAEAHGLWPGWTLINNPRKLHFWTT